MATMVTSAPYVAEAQAASLGTTASAPQSTDIGDNGDSAADAEEASLIVRDVDEALGFAATVAQQDEPEQSTQGAATAAAPEGSTSTETASVPAVDPSLPAADLSLTISADRDPVLSESFVNFTVEVTNAGPDEATNVIVTHELPGYMSFITMTGCWLANNTFPDCHLNEIAAGETKSFEVIVMTSPDAAGPQITAVSVTSETADPDPTNNTASTESMVNTRATWRDLTATADLSIVKLDLVDPVPALGTINYSILVSNAGPSPAFSVEVVDVLPAGVTLVSAAGCVQVGTELTCNLGTIAPQAMSSLAVTVTADAGTNGEITNTATVQSETLDPIGSNNTATQTTTINTTPTAGDDAAAVAENAGATIVNVLTNDNDADGDALTVTAVDATGTTGVVALTNGVVTYDPNGAFDTLAVGATATDTFTYDVSDGNGGTATATVTITINGVNEAPVAVADTATVSEDAAATTINVATNDTDANSDALTATAIDTTGTAGSVTLAAGVVSYDPNGQFETLGAGDTAIDTFTYDISDGNGGTDTATVAVSVTGVEDAPVISSNGGGSAAAITLDENNALATSVDSSDPDGDTDTSGGLTYTLTGPDAGLFSIDTTGALTFNATPDFETPGDANGDNEYEVTITVTDSTGLTVSQTVTVTIADVNDAPTIFAPFASNFNESFSGPLTTLLSADADGDTDNGGGLTYSLTGPDAGVFSVDANTGQWSLPTALDFENPTDTNGDGTYEVTFVVTDSGGLTDTQAHSYTVTNTNEVPALSVVASVTLAENLTAVVDVNSSDPEGETELGAGLFYTLGGTDSALFSIDAGGNLAFNAAADFENAGDAGTDNVYDLTITVTDSGGLVDTQAFTVTVTNVNEAPTFTNVPSLNIAIQETISGTLPITIAANDPDGETDNGGGLTYSLTGPDADSFAIDANTGAWSMPAPLDFENPSDADNDGLYLMTFVVTDAAGLTDTSDHLITSSNANEAPIITAPATASVAENTTAVLTATSSDPDAGDTAVFTLSGDDADDFNIDAGTGVLTFDPAPDFETPGDVGGDNIYNVTITVTDGGNFTDTQDVAITVTGVNEAPTVNPLGTVSANESFAGSTFFVATATDPDTGDTVTYSLSGNDATPFAIDATTGAISLPASLDFENPTDSDNDNVYDITVVATDSGGLTGTNNLPWTVVNVNEAPTITAAATATVPENTTAVLDASSTDPDGSTDNGGGLTYSLSGPDNALFSIDAAGTLAFSAAPDFETPGDADLDNVYNVTITVTDTSFGFGFAPLTDTQDVVITVTDQDDPPAITSDGAGATAAVDSAENQTAVTDVNSTDPEGDTEGSGLTYALTGDDAGFFSIDGSGVLTWNAAPDFETALDNGADNVYDVIVTVTDSDSLTDVQAIAVTVTDVNEAPTVTAASAANVAENTTAVLDASSSDPDGETDNGGGLTYSLTGPDNALFSVDATGALAFSTAPDFETPASNAGTNVYSVTITVSDGALTDTQDVDITVTNVDDPPVITTDGAGATAAVGSAENQTAVTDVDSTDDEGDTEGSGLGYALTGDDASFFSIDGSGVLTWLAAPDFETPLDNGADNVYDVIVTVTDSQLLTDVQAIAITVTNVNEMPSITTGNSATIAENTTAVFDVDSSDLDGETESGGGLTYATGGTDGALFSIDAAGNLAFIAAPDFDVPGDSNGDNTYELTITVTDVSLLTAVQNFTVSLTDVNEAPVITSDGGGATAAVIGAQGSTAVTTVVATDPEGTTPTYSLSGADSALFAISPAGVLTFNVAPAAAATLTITVTASDGVLDDTQDITITVPPNTAPTAVDDVYSNLAVNVRLDAGTGTAGIDVDDADGVLTKGTDDSDPEANPLSVTQVNGAAITSGTAITLPSGATLTMFTNGTFTYVSAPGTAAATDTFTYTVSDGQLTDTATVTINFGADTIWFIDNSAGGAAGTGTSVDPFDTIAAFNAATTDTGDLVYLQTGTYADSGIVLTASQRLVGQGVALTSGALSIPAGTAPTITAATGDGVTLATNNTVTGVNIGNTPAGHGIAGSNVGTPTISNVAISGTGGIVDINGGNLTNVTLGNSVSTSAVSGVVLQNLTGTFNPGGTIALANTSGTAVQLVNNSTASITLPGLAIDNSGTNAAGVVASGGGSLSITLPGGFTNTINTGSAAAVDINGMSLGVLLTRVDSVGGTDPGISLVNTTGFFSISGSTVGCETNAAQCSGGSITNKTGNTDGIVLNNVTNVTLNDMNISGNSGNGISGTTVNPFVIDDSRVTNNGSSPAQENGLRFSELTGTVTISNTLVSGSFTDEVSINNSTGTLTALNVTNSTFGPNASTSMLTEEDGDNGLQLLSSGDATINLNANGNTFNGARNVMLLVDLAGTGGGSVNIGNGTANTFTLNQANIGHAIEVAVGGGNTVSATVSNNTITAGTSQFVDDVVALRADPGFFGTFNITAQNNQIGTDGVNGSAVSSASGGGDAAITVFHETGTVNMLIDGNSIFDFNQAGIEVFYGSNMGTGTVNATVTNNTVRDAAGASSAAIEFIGDSTANTCQHVSGNTVNNPTGREIVIDSFATAAATHAIVGLTTLTEAGIEALWATNNGGLAPTTDVRVFPIDSTITGAASCPQP